MFQCTNIRRISIDLPTHKICLLHTHAVAAQELKHGVLRHLAFLHLEVVVEARPFKLLGLDRTLVDQAREAFAPASSGQRLGVNRRYLALERGVEGGASRRLLKDV